MSSWNLPRQGPTRRRGDPLAGSRSPGGPDWRPTQQAKQRYLQAGQSAESTFALSERSSTMQDLVQWASGDDPSTEDTIEESLHGGREYGGFSTAYLDYLENAGQIQQKQLSQQVELQKDNWDARYEELEYKESLWESKMQTILSRGKDQWAAAENAFLTRWNDTKSAEEAEIAAAEAKWQQRIDDHYAEKQAWEEQRRLSASVPPATLVHPCTSCASDWQRRPWKRTWAAP